MPIIKNYNEEDTIKDQHGFLRHFIIVFSIIIICLSAIGYTKVSLSHRLDEINRRLLDTLAVIEETKSLATTLQVIRLAERGYLLTGEQQYVQTVETRIATFTRQLEELRSHIDQPERFDALELEFISMMEETIQPLMAMRTVNEPEVLDQGMLLSLMGEARRRADALIDKLNHFEEEQDELLEFRQAEVERWARRDRAMTIFGPIIIIAVSLAASLYAMTRLDRYKRQQMEDRASIRYARDRLAAVIDSSNLGTWEWNIATGEILINDQMSRNLGYERGELEPFTFDAFAKMAEPEDFNRSIKILEEVFRGERYFYSSDIRLRHKDGQWVWMLDRGQVVSRDERDKPLIMMGTHTDVTERVESAQRILVQEEESLKLFEAMTQGFAYCRIITDEEGKPIDYIVLRLNKRFVEQTGVSASQLVGNRITVSIPGVESVWIEKNGNVALTGEPAIFEAYNAFTERRFLASSYSPQRGYFAMLLTDITDEHALETQLAAEKSLFETTLMSVADGIITTDEQGVIRFMNGPAELLTGWLVDEARNRTLDEVFKIFDGPEGRRISSPFERVKIAQGEINAREGSILISRDGVQRYVAGKATPIIDSGKVFLGIVIIVRDVTDERKIQREILNLSYIDPLTGLYNRRYYEQQKEIFSSEEHYPLSVILADVNGLKLINDAFGHDAGDKLLQTVAKAFKGSCPKNGIATRIGGDEFVILIPNCSEEVVGSTMKQVTGLLEEKRVRGIPVSVSFGQALKNSDSIAFEHVFKQAEDVMYQNKMTTNLSYKKGVIATLLQRLFTEDPLLEAHSEQVGRYCAELARVSGFPPSEIEQMYLAGLHHDLGRIAIDPKILEKDEDDLSQSELVELRRHSEIGYNLLSTVTEYAFLALAILHHHERWDGRGYPQGLAGTAIPRSAQILAIANIYVWASEQPNSTEEEWRQFIIRQSGTYLDPVLVELFCSEVLGTPLATLS